MSEVTRRLPGGFDRVKLFKDRSRSRLSTLSPTIAMITDHHDHNLDDSQEGGHSCSERNRQNQQKQLPKYPAANNQIFENCGLNPRTGNIK